MCPSHDDAQTVGRIFHANDALPRLEDGAILRFERSIAPAEHDMIVIALSSGEERVLHIEGRLSENQWTVSLMKGVFNTRFGLLQVDPRTFRVVLEAHHQEMPEAF